jgi:hypothetical protein
VTGNNSLSLPTFVTRLFVFFTWRLVTSCSLVGLHLVMRIIKCERQLLLFTFSIILSIPSGQFPPVYVSALGIANHTNSTTRISICHEQECLDLVHAYCV